MSEISLRLIQYGRNIVRMMGSDWRALADANTGKELPFPYGDRNPSIIRAVEAPIVPHLVGNSEKKDLETSTDDGSGLGNGEASRDGSFDQNQLLKSHEESEPQGTQPATNYSIDS